jgi:hypothetical protein
MQKPRVTQLLWKIPRIWLNMNIYNHVHKQLPLISVLRYMNTAHTLQSYLFEIIQSTLMPSFGVSYQNFACGSLPCRLHVLPNSFPYLILISGKGHKLWNFLQPPVTAYKIRGKAVPVLNYAPSHEDIWQSRGIAPPFLTSALAGCDWSASWPCCFNPRKRCPSTHWTGGFGGSQSWYGHYGEE